VLTWVADNTRATRARVLQSEGIVFKSLYSCTAHDSVFLLPISRASLHTGLTGLDWTGLN
jgi:hypothetical protein